MLSEPRYGWCGITIGTWTDRCSYLDDVPFMLPDAMLQALSKGQPVAISFDAEGYDNVVVFCNGTVHVITDKSDEYELVSQDMDIKGLAAELASDLRRDIDGWTNWLSYEEPSDADLADRRAGILSRCGELERLSKGGHNGGT